MDEGVIGVRLYSEEIAEGTVSIGYETFEVKDHVLEIPEEAAQGWDPGPLWEPHDPRKHGKKREVKSDDSETE